MTHDGPYKISLFGLTRFLRHVDAKEVVPKCRYRPTPTTMTLKMVSTAPPENKTDSRRCGLTKFRRIVRRAEGARKAFLSLG